MADRDLLHKPMPLVSPESDDAHRNKAAPPLGKLGVAERAREIAREADAAPLAGRPGAGRTEGRAPAAPASAPEAKAPEAAPKEKAFRAAYFNRDVAATGAINQRSQQMAALRGQEGAADLRRVVLPQPPGAENPSPERLHSALARMAGEAGEAGLDFAHLLGRQAAWTRSEGVTPDMVAALQHKLARMIEARRTALLRLRKLSPGHLDGAPTLAQAVVASDEAGVQAADPQAEAEALIDANARRGTGMLRRLAKVMGSKR